MGVDLKTPILIVDDYKTMLRIVRNLFKQFGFENVDEAADGGEAFIKMKDKQYGLVISDLNMEPVTGIQLFQKLRADANLKDTPFIMITEKSKTENVIVAKGAGVRNNIVKPFNAKALKQKLTAVLGSF